MGRSLLKPSAQIIAEMMSRGAARGISGIGSNDPGPEFVGRAHRAVEEAKVLAKNEFLYPRPDYPFDRHEEAEKYIESFNVDAHAEKVTIENTAPSAKFVEEGRPAISARRGKALKLPLKPRFANRVNGPVIRVGNKFFLLRRKVAASDGYGIIKKAIISSFSR